jgi:hypothetical protein
MDPADDELTPFSVAWDRVATDASNFSIVLTNLVSLSSQQVARRF